MNGGKSFGKARHWQPVEIGVWPKEIGADYLIVRTGRERERPAAESLSEALVLLRHKFLRKFGGKLRAHAGHRGSRAWPIA